MFTSPGRRAGFTLIELLVTIAVIGVLVALLLPAVQQVREAARRSSCKHNLRQLALALHNYHDDHFVLPAGQYYCQTSKCDTGNALSHGWGWSASILPYADQATLANQLNFSIPMTDAAMQTLVRTQLPVFQCPTDLTRRDLLPPAGSAASPHRVAGSNYCGNGGSFGFSFEVPFLANNDAVTNGVLGRNSAVAMDHIVDGLSNTVLLGEVIHYDFPWDPTLFGHFHPSTGKACCTLSLVRQGAWSMNPGKNGNQTRQRESFSSLHAGGANFALCDGSVRFISENIHTTSRGPFAGGGDPFDAAHDGAGYGVWQRLFSRNDGLPVHDF